MSGFPGEWDMELAAEFAPLWVERHYMTGALMDVSQLVSAVDHILTSHPSVSMGTVTISPRLIKPEVFPTSDKAPDSGL